MAATVVLVETNGPQATSTETVSPANLNFGSSDASELTPGVFPITSGGFSYEKWIQLRVTDMGDSSVADNFRVWASNLGDGGLKIGETIRTSARRLGYVQPTYPTDGPVNTESTIATEPIPTEFPASGANIGVGGSLTGQITAAPNSTDFVVFQLGTTVDTPAGPLEQKTFTFQWDEQ